jgi:integrase
VLRTILLAAVQEDLILRSPCRKITLPTGRPARVPEVLDVDQTAAVLANLRGAGVHALVLTTLGTGLRWQEVAWLRRRDVDLLRRQLRVHEVLKTATKASGGMYGGPPKSRAGARPVPLPAAVVQALAALLPTGGGIDDIVFPSSRGTVRDRGSFVQNFLRPAAKAAGVERLQFHDLRRTYASWLEDGGIPRIVIKELLGHAREGHHRAVPVGAAVDAHARGRGPRYATAGHAAGGRSGLGHLADPKQTVPSGVPGRLVPLDDWVSKRRPDRPVPMNCREWIKHCNPSPQVTGRNLARAS